MKKAIPFILLLLLCFSVQLSSQAFSLKIGVFAPALDSDLWAINLENLAMDRSDLLSTTYGAEYEFFLNRFASLSFEMGSYTKSVFSQYRDYEFLDGTPIRQNISLRITPIEIGAKLYPLSYRRQFILYLGASAGIYAWNFEQWGSFINFQDFTVSEGNAVTRTYTPGFSVRSGISYRFMYNIAFLLEAKYQYLRGRLSGFFQDFEKLDLSGFQASLGITYYFR